MDIVLLRLFALDLLYLLLYHAQCGLDSFRLNSCAPLLRKPRLSDGRGRRTGGALSGHAHSSVYASGGI